MAFLSKEQIERLNNLMESGECLYCNKGYAVRDIGRNTRAWIKGEEFVIQEFDRKTDRPFERKFKMVYCPYCGRMIKKKINGIVKMVCRRRDSNGFYLWGYCWSIFIYDLR